MVFFLLNFQALVIREAALGASHPTTAVTLARLGSLYLALGELEEAEVFLSRALNARRAALGPDHPETAESMGKLGMWAEQAEVNPCHTVVFPCLVQPQPRCMQRAACRPRPSGCMGMR